MKKKYLLILSLLLVAEKISAESSMKLSKRLDHSYSEKVMSTDRTGFISNIKNTGPTLPFMAFKNNLLYTTARLINIETEFYFSKRWSLNIEYQGAYWSFKKSNLFYQLTTISPEMRFWFFPDSEFKKHFIGVYTSCGYYDFKHGKIGYLGEFYYSAGISYGYYLPIKPLFGIEFSLGIGYMQLKYDQYMNNESMTEHYYQIAEKTTTYIGPTKAKISLVWRIKNKK